MNVFEKLASIVEKWAGKRKPEEPVDVNDISFFKDAMGQWWFYGIYSNKFRDRHWDILSEKSHTNYAEWLKTSGFKPLITIYHNPRSNGSFWYDAFEAFGDNVPFLQLLADEYFRKFSIAKVERVAYVNGFMTVVAKVLPGREPIAEKLASMTGLGMSHGFVPLDISFISNGKWDSIINEYRTFEMSILRRKHAANLLTSSSLVRKGGEIMEKGFGSEEREFLVELFGEDFVNEVERDTKKAEELISRVRDYKSMMGTTKKEEQSDVEVPVTEPTPVADETPATVETPVVTEEVSVNVEVKQLADGLNVTFTELQKVLTEMQKQLEANRVEIEALRKELGDQKVVVQEVTKSEDERVAQLFTPNWNWRAGYSASQADDNIVTKEEKEDLVKNAPTGSQPNFDPNNVLNLGFWQPVFGDNK